MNGFFVESKWSETGPTGQLSGIDIIGYDATTEKHVVSGFMSDGLKYDGSITIEGETHTIESSLTTSDGKKYLLRDVVKFAPDRASYTSTWEISDDGGSNWTQWLKFDGEKIGD